MVTLGDTPSNDMPVGAETVPSPAGDLRPPARSRRFSKEFLLQPDDWQSLPKPSPVPAPDSTKPSQAHVPFKLTLVPPPLHMPASLEATTRKLEATEKLEAGLQCALSSSTLEEEAEEEAMPQAPEVRQEINIPLNPTTPT